MVAEVSGRKSLVAVWRDAVRDSDLKRTSKLLAFVLSTYLNRYGSGWPSQETLAAGASITVRSVQKNTAVLEHAGFVAVERSVARLSHRYTAILPPTANPVRHAEWQTANGNTPKGERHVSNPERGSPESVESVESGALHADAVSDGIAASARGTCVGCGEDRRLVDGNRCPACLIRETA
jgi:hypothetical protein